MSNKTEQMSLITKSFILFAILVLFLWVAPTAISYYKNRNLYNHKVAELETLDKREIPSDIKPFHTEIFKADAQSYFDEVDVVSIPNNEYNITISFNMDKLPKFYDFLKNLSLNYKVSVKDTLIYRGKNNQIDTQITIKPY
jgi:hypothetical protein